MDELLARVRAAVRRAVPDQPPAPVVDRRLHRRPRGHPGVRATARRSGSPRPSGGCSRRWSPGPAGWSPQRQLLSEGWGPGYSAETNYLRVYVAGLRRKLEPDPSRPRHLLTEPGMGYRFVP